MEPPPIHRTTEGIDCDQPARCSPSHPQVIPWVADVSDIIATPGRPSLIAYRGLFNGTDPAPEPGSQPGYIMMSSFLTFYGRQQRERNQQH